MGMRTVVQWLRRLSGYSRYASVSSSPSCSASDAAYCCESLEAMVMVYMLRSLLLTCGDPEFLTLDSGLTQSCPGCYGLLGNEPTNGRALSLFAHSHCCSHSACQVGENNHFFFKHTIFFLERNSVSVEILSVTITYA